MKSIFKLLLALSLITVAISWSEEKPEEDFCDAEWDGKVEYKEEGEKDEATSPEEEKEKEEEPESAPSDEGGEDQEKEHQSEGEEKEEGGTEPSADGEGEHHPEEEGQQHGGGGEPEGEGEQPAGEEPAEGGGSQEDAKSDPANTYRKSAELVRDAANIDAMNIQDEYLKSSVNNRLQEFIRNPIIGASGRLPNFKKIASCFKTMKQDLKKEIDGSKKNFDDCKKNADSYDCMVKTEPGFADHVKAIGQKIVQCMQKS